MRQGPPRVLLLNGGSSSGKSTLAASLQYLLDGYWLRLGVDTLIDSAPARLLGPTGLALGPDGSVGIGTDFAELEAQWTAGLAAMVAAGARLLIEDNFVSGPASQQRWRQALDGLPVGWVGVRCPPELAAARELNRPDRIAGMAELQAESVHRGIDYDLEVDTGQADPAELARLVCDHFGLAC